MKVSKMFDFHSAHHLPGHPTCGVQHGHTWDLEVEVEGTVEDGMVVDFKKLKDWVTETILSKLDHSDINDTIKYPSAENMAIWIWRQLCKTRAEYLGKATVHLITVRLWETKTSKVEYNGT